MIDEEANEVVRYNEVGSEIPSDEAWSPIGREDLILELTTPTVVTSIQVTDQVEEIFFKVSYKPEDEDTFIEYVGESGEPQVSLTLG